MLKVEASQHVEASRITHTHKHTSRITHTHTHTSRITQTHTHTLPLKVEASQHDLEGNPDL